jgi:hypothetical protein
VPGDDIGTAVSSTTWGRIATKEEEDTMGKLIVTEFVTLDGVAQAPGGPDEDRDGGFTHGGWQAPFVDQKSGHVLFEQASSMDALLLGRRTYEIFASYWPQAPEEIPFTGLPECPHTETSPSKTRT